jgi:hypothetical protein
MQKQDENLTPLWKVPRDSWISVEDVEEPILFKHVDGMYSLCYLKGEPVHLAAFTNVKILYKNPK